MDNLTIKEYAELKGVTYQAIAKHIKTNKDIKELVIKEHGVTVLPVEAQLKLDKLVQRKKIARVSDSEYERQLKAKDLELENLKADYEEQLQEQKRLVLEIQEKYNKDKADFLEFEQKYLNEIRAIETQYKQENKMLLEDKTKSDNKLLLAVYSRKERRRIKKELKSKNKVVQDAE